MVSFVRIAGVLIATDLGLRLAIILGVKLELSISVILLKNISGPGHPSLYRT
jgi:hypothetical protein